MRVKTVADGQLVEIPVPCMNRTVGTQKDRKSQEWKNWCKRKGCVLGKSGTLRLKRYADRNKVEKLPNPSCQEKPLLFHVSPYRKPTQVDEERILRPTGEALLRNSAK